MKKLVFMVIAMLMFFVLSSCASGDYKIMHEGKTDVKIKFRGQEIDCSYEDEVSSENFAQTALCSFKVITSIGTYACSKIKMTSLDKNFDLETECAIEVISKHNKRGYRQTGDLYLSNAVKAQHNIPAAINTSRSRELTHPVLYEIYAVKFVHLYSIANLKPIHADMWQPNTKVIDLSVYNNLYNVGFV